MSQHSLTLFFIDIFIALSLIHWLEKFRIVKTHHEMQLFQILGY